ncbi:MAG: HNH endonuclease [Endomicrobia bacterium]|nr:HNH endonuclease [Endomicrobiia bacterium]MCL2506180.1 HNH endonuclease [Endomicrobiia bacterium]
MIKVTLPDKKTLIQGVTDNILHDVCKRIFNTTVYKTENEKRGKGRYIKIENSETNEIHYVCFSHPNHNSRNAHLMQFVSPAYIAFYNDKAENKHLDIYLINPSVNDKTDYIRMFYRCFLTIGIRILNFDKLGISEVAPFNSYEDLKGYRSKTSGRNTHNRSTYFTDDDKQISIFGKTFGANAMESFIFGLTIKQIVDKPVVFYPVLDNESDSLSVEQRQILMNKGLSYGNSIELLTRNGPAKPTKDTSRNQSVFHYNLLQKFGDKQCYICGCDIERLIIAAHIERVTDIDNSASYTPEQKAQRSTDGDNGLWLCASHDKMFEYGIIYFENTLMRVGAFITEQSQQTFIERSIFDMRQVYFNDITGTIFEIKSEHYNDKMRDYISKHMARIT